MLNYQHSIILLNFVDGFVLVGIKRRKYPFLYPYGWYIILHSAGSCAGITEHISMIPIDNVKTHCQVGRSLGIAQIVKKIYHAGGFFNFYAGSSVVIGGCIPAHALYFSIYEQGKVLLKCK